MINKDLNKKLKKLLLDDKCYNPATIFNPLSARMAADVGFELGIIPGKIISLDYLSEPDLMLLTLTELTETVRRIAKYTQIPLIVDADNGYGNAINVNRTIESLEDAGVSGITIEDTDLPIKFGNTKKPEFLNLREAALKISMAVKSKQSDTTSIIARTGAYPYNGINDILDRGKAYESEGADALFFVNINSQQHLHKIAESFKTPIILGNNSTKISLTDLADMGISISLPGHKSYFLAMEAYKKAIKDLRKTGNYDETNINIDNINQLSNELKYSEIIRKYMED
tara:strand:+ start:60800 stop:61654 length:855 start_codon:yes stop_codon:yes gene_type:complete